MNTHTLAIIAYVLSVTACQSGNRQEERSANHEQKYCFLRLEGNQLQDSSFIQLEARKGTVSGIYNVVPHEKDARRGTVLGKSEDDVFDLVWTFSQEGNQDTLRVVFKLKDGKLLRKPLAVDTLTGRQITLDTSAFSEVYEPMDCVVTHAGDYAGSL
ncbi:hypothetical protein [Parapedobacter sp. 2B3]|uniref:hypothetical protein n=1 Tax=Parapedobacter sp. 2B3 TaxID=3342381 RepID=UPI0035B59F32